MTTRARFRQADLTKALQGAQNAGLQPTRVIIEPDGRIRLEFEQRDNAGGGKRIARGEWADLE